MTRSQMIGPVRTLALRRYKALKAPGYKPTGRDHQWGNRFEQWYPVECPYCECQTRNPFDRSDIIHDVDACSGGGL